MGLFHVYVEAPDRSPQTITRLAETIGKKYGVPVAELEKRLTAGRFRVKANIDRATADVYAKALADSGAIVKIEDALPTQPVPVVSKPVTPSSGAPVVAASQEGSGSVARTPAQLIPRSGTTTPPLGAPRAGTSSLPPATTSRPATSSLPPATTSRSGGSSLPPANAARTSSPSLPPTTTAPRATTSSLPPANAAKAPAVASGLSAAYTESASTDLGALGTDSLSLASLDGNDDAGDEAFAPPVDLSPSLSPAPAAVTPAKAAKPAKGGPKGPKPNNDPVDLFAPPDAAEDAAFQVELASDEVEHRAKKMSTPPAGVPTAPPVAATPQLQQSKKRATPAAGAPITVASDAQETPRWRFAAGVMLSILLGFLPAHLIASARESSAFAKIDASIIEIQDQADSADLYEALDAFRDAQREHKQGEKKSIAMMSMLIWGIAGGGIAYVWFRRVPWDKLLRRSA